MKTLRRNGLKGQQAFSPGHRPGLTDGRILALKGQKAYRVHDVFALTGRWLRTIFTQGDAMGWEFSGLSGRLRGTYES